MSSITKRTIFEVHIHYRDRVVGPVPGDDAELVTWQSQSEAHNQLKISLEKIVEGSEESQIFCGELFATYTTRAGAEKALKLCEAEITRLGGRVL